MNDFQSTLAQHELGGWSRHVVHVAFEHGHKWHVYNRLTWYAHWAKGGDCIMRWEVLSPSSAVEHVKDII